MEKEALARYANLLKRMCALIIQKTSSSSRFAFPGDEKTNSLFRSIVQKVYDIYGSVTHRRLADIAIYIEYVFRENGGRRRFVGYLTQMAMKYNQSMLESYQRRKYAMTKFEDRWLGDFGLSRGEVANEGVNSSPESRNASTNHEDASRRRFLNSVTGYVYCHKLTSGWDPSSIVCNECLFAEQCKSDLKESCPTLYSKRNELSG